MHTHAHTRTHRHTDTHTHTDAQCHTKYLKHTNTHIHLDVSQLLRNRHQQRGAARACSMRSASSCNAVIFLAPAACAVLDFACPDVPAPPHIHACELMTETKCHATRPRRARIISTQAHLQQQTTSIITNAINPASAHQYTKKSARCRTLARVPALRSGSVPVKTSAALRLAYRRL